MRKTSLHGCKWIWFCLAALLSGALTLAAMPTSDQLLQFLSHTVDWYQQLSNIDQTPINAQELVFRSTVRESARNAVRSAFVVAQLESDVLSINPRKPTTQKLTGPAERLPQMMASTDAEIVQLESQVQDAAVAAQSAQGGDAQTARARQFKLQAQLNLAHAQSEVMHNYADFLSSGSGNNESLSDRIDDLQRSVPETAPAATTRPSSTAQASTIHEANGLLSVISELFTLTRRMSTLTTLAATAEDLKKQNDQLHDPVRTQILDLMHRGDLLASSTQPTTNVSELNSQRDAIDAMAGSIKKMSALGLALSQQRLDLDATRDNLTRWREAIGQQYESDISSLVMRIIVTVIIVVLIIVISELWRRATYRYVHDTRRRRQLMLIRRIVISIIALLIIIASVVTEFGSLATFAGLITAGIAVSLQTVILSGVAYFFFIGRFGVRVGDRVTISGITGDVVEVGLFRLYLMELSGKQGDLHSTGRMIVFSNAVVFQPSAFYKQLPGTQYVWREVGMTLSPDGDHLLAEKRLMEAVQSVFKDYKQSIDAQHERAMETLHVTIDRPQPEGRLRFVDSGVEYVIRYPVELEQASFIDDRMTRALLEAINQEPKLKFASSATPRIQVTG